MRWFFILFFSVLCSCFLSKAYQAFTGLRDVVMVDAVSVTLPPGSYDQRIVFPSDGVFSGGEPYVLHNPRPLSQMQSTALCYADKRPRLPAEKFSFSCGWQQGDAWQRATGFVLLPQGGDVRSWYFDHEASALIPLHMGWLLVNIRTLVSSLIYFLFALLFGLGAFITWNLCRSQTATRV